MAKEIRIDYEVTDLTNRLLVPITSIWLAPCHEEWLEKCIAVGGYVDYPAVTNCLMNSEVPISMMRRGCDASGCFNWKTERKATSYIIIYKLCRVDDKYFRLRGFCVCACSSHEYLTGELDWDWTKATLECTKCKCDFFSSRLRILNRTSSVCHQCRQV